MAITSERLFELARRVELNIAAMYEDLAAQPDMGPDAMRFFGKLAMQEHTHALWVDEMSACVDAGLEFTAFSEEDFHVILSTIEDVHDEVLNEELSLPDALEIILHMENSTAEEFYLHFPPDIPGLAPRLIERMVRSCFDHAKEIEAFRRAVLRP